MNKKEKREVVGVGFLFTALIVGVANLWAILVLHQPAPFPPLSAVFGVTGLIILYWRNN